jgi:hypothetical protein
MNESDWLLHGLVGFCACTIPEIVVERQDTAGTGVLLHQRLNFRQVNLFHLRFIVQIISLCRETDDFDAFAVEIEGRHDRACIIHHHINPLSLRCAFRRIGRRPVIVESRPLILADDIGQLGRDGHQDSIPPVSGAGLARWL